MKDSKRAEAKEEKYGGGGRKSILLLEDSTGNAR
jgi:hypothetical protein